MRITLLLSLALLAAAQCRAADNQSVEDWPGSYDEYFRKNTKHYFGPGQDWRWFKAQAIAESGLDPDAQSDSGAIGIMQILPRTWREIKKENPDLQDISSPRWNIAAGIYYDRTMFNRWDSAPDDRERLLLAFGSYNAGYARIRKSVRLAKAAHSSWDGIKQHVPPQTRHYVRRIRKLMGNN